MNKIWVLLFEGMLIWLTALFILSILSAALYKLFRDINNRYVAEYRALALLIYSLMTPLTATLLLVLSFHPGWAEHLVGNHCHATDCLAHRPRIRLSSWTGISMLLIASMALTCFAFLLRQQWVRSDQRLRILQALSLEGKTGDYRVLNTPALLAWCTGFFRSRIYLSTGLLAALDGEQLTAVLAHERAHARRMDNLRRWIAYISTAAWPSPAKKVFWQDFFAATEEACDRQAVAELRNRSPLIEALDRISNASLDRHPAPSAHDPVTRICALQSPDKISGFPVLVCLAISAMTIIHILVLTSIVHHLLEHSTSPMLSILS